MKQGLFFLLLITALIPLPSQEILKSREEEYYDFLALRGLVERPTLNYRTLSDSIWDTGENSHPWNQNLGSFHPLFGDFHMRLYGPELFMSANTSAPYGQNDGVLWQGKGVNAGLSTGARFEGYGIELTLLPHLAFSQNLEYKIMPSNYDNKYGYFWGYGVDAPQRFGNKPFFDWDFGDSEIRYTWKTLTAGFGTQSIWLGPSYLNPILHSNNAPAYPKFDIGIRKQSVTIPRVDWYIGDIEVRLWVGYLSESDYFDDDDSNDHTMFHGLALAYAPSFLPGLTLFANRVCLVPWEWENLKYIYPIHANTIEDQKFSFGFSWLLPEAGFNVFGEMAIDDYVSGGLLGYVRHPFHCTVYSAGLKKSFTIKPEEKIYGELLFELNWMEMTQDYQLLWHYSFYFHHQIRHGYSNRGQWLANGVSPGGNSQYISFTLYYPKGNSTLFVSRNNPDSNFIYSKAVYSSAEDDTLHKLYYRENKANFLLGFSTRYFLNSLLTLSGGIAYNLIINPNYFYDNLPGSNQTGSNQNNFSFNFSLELTL